MTAKPAGIAGSLLFSEIPKLPPSWWTGSPPADPAIVWTVWDENTYYLWGANAGNYNQESKIGTVIGGSGLAGPNGPTLGRNHPHYIGIITMSLGDMPKNAPVFAALAGLVAGGNSVLVPIFPDFAIQKTGMKLALGTGIGASVPDWAGIQKSILASIVALGGGCSDVQIPAGTYWPDLRQTPPAIYPVTSLADIQTIIDTVLSTAKADA